MTEEQNKAYQEYMRLLAKNLQEAREHQTTANLFRDSLNGFFVNLAKEQKVDTKDKQITYKDEGYFIVEEPKKQEKLSEEKK